MDPTRWPHLVGSIIRRILDRRPYCILPDGGLTLITRGYAANLAHAVLLAVEQPEVASGHIYNCGDERLLSLHQWVEMITHTLEYDWEIVCVPGSVAHAARPLLPLMTAWHHVVMDLSKLKADLGYRDLWPIEEALPRTVRWYVEHPPARGGDIERNLHDPFHYAAEDQLVRVYKACLQQLAGVPFDHSPWYHPYAHPKQPGERDHRQR
jgi:nucleoside-diphosphate-sugar epimerase